jgi:hypothetical protein
MNAKLRTIEVDVETAGNESVLPPVLAQARAKGEGPWSPATLEEDAQRLAAFERTRMGVPWDEVKTWMQSWGAPNELPAPKLRKL